MQKKYRVISFDLDGTLWNFEKNSEETLRDLYAQYLDKLAIPDLTFDLFYQRYLLRNENLWREYSLGKATKEQVRVDRFLYTFDDLEIPHKSLAYKISDEYTLAATLKKNVYPYTHETLTHLKKVGYKIILMTNGFKEVQIMKLNNCHLMHYFDEIYYAEDLGYLKPDPHYFQQAMALGSFQAQEVLYIGDNYHADIYGAYQSGIDAVMIDHYKQHQKQLEFPYRVIHNLNEILHLV